MRHQARTRRADTGGDTPVIELRDVTMIHRACGGKLFHPSLVRAMDLSLIHISEPTRREWLSRMPSSA